MKRLLKIQVPPAAPPPSEFEELLLAARPIVQGVSDLDRFPDALRHGIEDAEAYLERCTVQQEALDEAVAGIDAELAVAWASDVADAWPNARPRGLAGYKAQLAEEVLGRKPCRYALRRALQELRRTSDLLPSIAKALEAIQRAQSRVSEATGLMMHLPRYIEAARAALAAKEAPRTSEPRGGSGIDEVA